MSSTTICENVSEERRVAVSSRVGYDARFGIGEYRGMGRYLRRFIAGIGDAVVGFCADGEADPDLTLKARGFRFYPLWEQVSLPLRAAQSGIDVLIAPYNTAPLLIPCRMKLVLVVHDLIYLRSAAELPYSRSVYQNFGRIYRRWVVPRAVRRADHIVCVSEYTRSELMRKFQVETAKLTIIPNSIDASWYSLRRKTTGQRYVFCVSGEAPNKNLGRALQGFAEYCERFGDHDTQFRVAGVKPAHHAAFCAIANHYRMRSRVEFLDYISDEKLRELYAGAAAFLFPSTEEGFGIPVLEALAAGVPVIASQASSIPEVGGDAALYFDPVSAPDMAEQLSNVLSNPELQDSMSRRGRQNALQFHPDVVDARIRGFWNRTLGGK